MATITGTITPEKVLEYSQDFTTSDLLWLIRRFKELVDKKPIPLHASLESAADLYADGGCSLGQAAEMAGVTGFAIQEAVYNRTKFYNQ